MENDFLARDLKSVFEEFRPHINGHQTAINKFLELVDQVEELQGQLFKERWETAKEFADYKVRIGQLEGDVNELTIEKNKWKEALICLTPLGSEFEDDPIRCFDFVRDQLETQKKFILDQNKRIKNDRENKWDKILLKTYMDGFNDELDRKKPPEILNRVLDRAYNLGRIDARVGDDVSSVDEQTEEEILERIKKQS